MAEFEDNSNFLSSLKALRNIHDITQKQMAAMLHMSESSYCRKENGVSTFTQIDIDRILEIFECSYRAMKRGIIEYLDLD